MLSYSPADLIGFTRLARLNLLRTLSASKREYPRIQLFNSAGSIKDRIAKRLVDQDESDGLIRPRDTLIEASSRNM